MIKLTNKIKNAIVHYIMISWDEIHKNDQPPIITSMIDEIEIVEEKIEKEFDENNIQIDSNQNSVIKFGEEDVQQPKPLIQQTSFISQKSEINLKMNDGIVF